MAMTLQDFMHGSSGAFFCAVHSGSDLDRLMEIRGRRIGVEFKRADAPCITRSTDTPMDDRITVRPLRDWVPADHLVHFILDAVDALDLRQVKVNPRGTGSEQYPPHLLLGLLIYSSATGTFGSRRIEQSTYDSVPVRLLTADTHPDHDTLCTFRRENRALLTESFVKVLPLAQRLQVLKFGQLTVAADGTKVLASASKHSAVSYQRAGEMIEQLELEVSQLLAKAEAADATPLQDGLTIPDEITRRQERKAALAQVRAEIEAHAQALRSGIRFYVSLHP